MQEGEFILLSANILRSPETLALQNANNEEHAEMHFMARKPDN